MVRAITRPWHLLLAGTAVVSVPSSIYVASQGYGTAYAVIGWIDVALLVLAELYHWFGPRDLVRVARVRILVDNGVFAAAVLLLQKHVDILTGAYAIVSLLHIYACLAFLGGDRASLWIVRVVNLVVAALCWFVTPAIAPNWVIFVMVMTILGISVLGETAIAHGVSSARELLRQKSAEMRLLRHNLDNLTCVLLAAIDSWETTNVRAKKRAEGAVAGIRNAVLALCAEPASFLLARTVADIKLCMGPAHPLVQIVDNVERDATVTMRISPLLSALMVLVANACEATAKTVLIELRGKVLVVDDDGKGFDTSKIALGYTTKRTGHGQGLVHTIDVCRDSGIPLTIESTPGKGTVASIDLSRVMETEAPHADS